MLASPRNENVTDTKQLRVLRSSGALGTSSWAAMNSVTGTALVGRRRGRALLPRDECGGVASPLAPVLDSIGVARPDSSPG
jgi:hypothetical protein